MKRIGTVFALASMAMIVTAQAAAPIASLGQFHGKVLVNHGKGFEAVAGLVSLNVGDQVMVGAEGAAVISYVTGCDVSVNQPKVVTIGSKAPCKAGSASLDAENTFIVPAADMDPGVVAPIFPLPLLLIGGAAAVGGTIYLINHGKNTTPAATPTAVN
jgi:hypothetical protein